MTVQAIKFEEPQNSNIQLWATNIIFHWNILDSKEMKANKPTLRTKQELQFSPLLDQEL